MEHAALLHSHAFKRSLTIFCLSCSVKVASVDVCVRFFVWKVLYFTSFFQINGVGPVTEAVLKGIGLEKCGDLYEQRGMVGLLFTQFNYEYFLRIALGIFHVYTADRKSRRKSISTERTFHPTGDLTALLEVIFDSFLLYET